MLALLSRLKQAEIKRETIERQEKKVMRLTLLANLEKASKAFGEITESGKNISDAPVIFIPCIKGSGKRTTFCVLKEKPSS